MSSATSNRTRSFLIAVAVAAAAPIAAIGCASSAPATNTAGTSTAVPATAGSKGSAGSTPGTTVAVQKDTLATEVDPPGAPGRTLTLMRYTIAPGAKLSPHIHPGVQLASIESGTLTYTVVEGSTVVTRANGTRETLTAPTTVKLTKGDAVAENDGMVHFGANETDQPVVIIATLLTQSDKDLAVVVTTTTPS